MRPALVLFTAVLIACGGAAAIPAADPRAPRVIDAAAMSADLSANEGEVSMEIIELMCNPCAAQIVGQARLVPGVTHVSMVLASKTLTLRFDRALVARDALISSVEQIVASIQ